MDRVSFIRPSNRSVDSLVAVPFTIGVVSDSQLLWEGLSLLLSAHFPTAAIVTSPIETYLKLDPGDSNNLVILLDSSVGQTVTVGRIQKLRNCLKHVKIIALELHDSVDVILAHIEAGANGYMLKSSSVAELAQIIENVRCGLSSCSPQITAELFQRVAHLSSGTAAVFGEDLSVGLTARETEVLDFLVQGYSNKEIASRLVIEVRTVKHHVHNILSKLNVQHRWDAARMASEQGWFKESSA